MSESFSDTNKQRRFRLPGGTSSFIERQEVVQQQLSLTEIWRTIFKRKAIIIAFAAATFFLAALYTFTKTPLYEGSARLQIDLDRSSSLGLDDLLSQKLASSDSNSRIQTEVKIIQSDTVAMQVMKSLSIARNRSFAGPSATPASIIDLSQTTPLQRQRLLNKFHDNLKVQVVPNTQVIEIQFRSPSPQLATDVVNSVIDEYLQRNFNTRYEGTMQVSQWLSKQMEELRDSTSTAQQKLADFQRENNILGTNASDNIVIDRLKQLNEQLTEAEADRIVKEARSRLAKSGNPELITTIAPNATLQILRTQEADLRVQYSQLNTKFGSGYPKVREIQSQITRIDAAIDTEVKNVGNRLENDYMAAAKTEAMLHNEFEGQKEKAYKLNEHVAQYAILTHEVESGQQLYDTLQLKLKEAGVTAGLMSSYVSVVDRAQIPASPVEPRKPLYLAMGLFGGIFGGLVLGFVVDSVDDTVRTSEEVEATTGLPALGSVPLFVNAHRGGHRQLKSPTTVQGVIAPISIREPNCPVAEAYRGICSSVLLSSIDNPPKVLVVASAFSGEGKTTASCNLAVTLAQHGRRVLLVDADLRRATVHLQFGISKSPGLSNILAMGPEERSIRQANSNIPGFFVVTAGTQVPAPAEILASIRMQELIARWRTEYDHIVIDTPPILPVADALVLAARADGVVLVTRSGVSRKRALLRVRDVLHRSGANILGIVLNAVNMQLEYYYSYSGKSSYENYGSYYTTPAEIGQD